MWCKCGHVMFEMREQVAARITSWVVERVLHMVPPKPFSLLLLHVLEGP